MSKIIIGLIIIAVVVMVGGYLLLNKSETPASLSSADVATINENKEVSVTPTADQFVINYSNTGYSPNPLRVLVGATVVFKNESSRAMWPASAIHPTHTGYPTTGGCLGSTFDACRGVQPGDSWSFKFDVAGNWKYHDHLKPSVWGTIIVE